MNNDTKKCPYCGGEVKAIAIKCKHCGKFFEDEEKSENNSNNIYVGDNVLLILKKIFFVIVYVFCAFIWLLLILGIIGAMLPDDESSVDNSSQLVQQEQRQKELKNFEKETKKQLKEIQKQREKEEREIQKQQNIEEEQKKQERAVQAKQEKFEVLDTYICYENYFKAVCGVIRNNTDKKKTMVSIDIDLYDYDGNIVGKISDTIEELEPYQTWKFKALIDTDSVYRFQVKEVSSWW